MKITILLFLFSFSAFAAPKAYFAHSGGIFALDTLQVDGKTFNGHGGYYNFVEAVKSDPIAQKYARKHRTIGRWANGIMWGSLAVAITYLLATKTNNEGKKYGIYFGTAFGGVITGSLMMNSSRKYLHKAVNHYNGLKDKRVVFARYNYKF